MMARDILANYTTAAASQQKNPLDDDCGPLTWLTKPVDGKE